MRYLIFDCTKAHGGFAVVRHSWSACVVCALVSRLTGRTYDFAGV